MSVRHLERWPSADWGEIWFPVHMAGQKNRWLVAVFAAVCALRWPSYNESSSLQKRAKFEAKYIVNHD